MVNKMYLFLFSLLSLCMADSMAMRMSDAGVPPYDKKRQSGKRRADSIWRAASKGNVALVKDRIGKDSSLINKLDEKFGESPLHWAVKYHQESVIKCLLLAHADVNVQDKRGKAPLFWATRPSIVTLLLKNGAFVNMQDLEGKTPLHWAKDPAVIVLLIGADADVHLRDIDGKNALQWAAGSGNIDIVAQLLAAGADINSTDQKGMTALHSAVLGGICSMVEYLLAQPGIEVNRCDSIRQRSPLQYALRVCVGAKKKRNEQNSIGVTARMIIELMKNGANRYLPDRKRRTPEDWIRNMRCSNDEKALLCKAVKYQTLRNAHKQELLKELEFVK